ncbi:MAG TPA: SDR family NAD(P)-dependent oxidoreductase [Anaerolineales bacterium]|nr:SDR family NAD(P)-dependent oxidoreductase [Anaerolineales bacterium]
MSLQGKTVLITGGAVRVGRALSLAVARNGADVIIHYNRSQDQAKQLQVEIQGTGRTAHLLQADLSNPRRAAQLVTRALTFGPLFALVNNASLYEPLNLTNTNLENWECHLRTNLTAPFLLSQAFAKAIRPSEEGRIVNILDWRALRPGADHLPYTISKAGLAALTRSLAIALAPHVTVNGLALGAILPPGDQSASDDILDRVPSARWANLNELGQALLFLLAGPAYITGEIIHLDGGRHLI